MSSVAAPFHASPALPGGSNGNGDECDRCHKLLRGSVPRGKMALAWLQDNMCGCADEFVCKCACGRAPTTHVVEVASKSLAPWCGRKECKRVAAMSYRWPTDWKAAHPSIEVQGCAGCGQQPSDGPFARKDEQFAAMSAAYKFLWVDHWCTRGCADIPQLKSVYQQSDKVAIPLDGERPLSAKLAVLCVVWCFVIPFELAAQVFVRLLDGLRRWNSALASRPRLRGVLRWVAALPTIVLLIAIGVLLEATFLPYALGHCLAGIVQGYPPRSKRLWLRVESVYARTHSVLLPTGLTRSLRWRVSIDVLAREWGTWYWMPLGWIEGRAGALAKCDVYSVSDRFLVELLGGLDWVDFRTNALAAGREDSSARDPALPRWLPSSLGALYKPDTLMGSIIEARHIPGAVEATIHGEPHLVSPAPGGAVNVLGLRHDAEAGVFVLVKDEIVGSFDEDVLVACGRLSNIKL